MSRGVARSGCAESFIATKKITRELNFFMVHGLRLSRVQGIQRGGQDYTTKLYQFCEIVFGEMFCTMLSAQLIKVLRNAQ